MISALLQTLPPEQRETGKRDIASHCAKVAEASGGFIGFLGRRRVCTEERELLARIAAELERGTSGIGAAGYKRIASAEIVSCFDLKVAVNVSIKEENLLSELQELPT